MSGLGKNSRSNLGWPLGPVVLFLLLALNQYAPGFYALADEHAYMLSAKSLATRGTLALRPESPLQLVGQNYVMTAPGVYYAKHPPGTAVLLAAGQALGGVDGPPVVNVILGALAIVGVYLLGRDLSSPLGGAIAAGMLAVHPLFVLYALRPMSHVPDACFSTWAMWALWRWYRAGGKIPAMALALLLASAICIRYTNVMLLLPVAVLIAMRWRRSDHRRQVIIETVTSGGVLLLALLPLAIFHATAFGSPLRTGYAFTRESAAFSPSLFADHLITFLRWANTPGFGLFAILPLACAATVVLLRRAPAKLALLALWAAPVVLLYVGYYWMPPKSSSLYLRLFLSGYAAAMLLTIVAAVSLLGPSLRAKIILVALAASIAGANLAMPTVWHDLTLNTNMAVAALDTAHLALVNLPPGSAVFADAGSAYYLDYAGNYFLWDPAVFDAASYRHSTDLPAQGPTVFDPRRAEELRRLRGPLPALPDPAFLEQQARLQLARGRRVAVLCPAASVPTWRKRFSAKLQMTSLGTSALGWQLLELTATE